MKTPLVSVLTRTKDRPEFLKEAIASVAAQTHPRIQHVIVNDGGADVAHVIEPFRGRLDVAYLSPGPVGRCRAGNLALEAARGDYLAWLDDDDLYYPRHLASLVAFAEETGSKVVYSQADVIHQTKDPATGRYVDVRTEPAPTFEWSKIALWTKGEMHLVTILYAREVYERLGGFDESIPVLEDLELFGRMAQEYDFKRRAEATAAYRVRDDLTNAVTSLRKEFVATRQVLMSRHAHIVLPEMIATLEHGERALAALTARVAALEAEVRRLGGGGPEPRR